MRATSSSFLFLHSNVYFEGHASLVWLLFTNLVRVYLARLYFPYQGYTIGTGLTSPYLNKLTCLYFFKNFCFRPQTLTFEICIFSPPGPPAFGKKVFYFPLTKFCKRHLVSSFWEQEDMAWHVMVVFIVSTIGDGVLGSDLICLGLVLAWTSVLICLVTAHSKRILRSKLKI